MSIKLLKNSPIALISLGCPKNQVDAENMLALIEEAGYPITDNLADASAIVVNTCGFIQSAKEEAIEAILDAADYKTNGQCKKLLVTGCLAQRYAEDIQSSLPEVDAILGTSHYQSIVQTLDTLLVETDESAFVESTAPATQPIQMTSHLNKERIAHLHSNRKPSSPYYAYLKVSEGCRHNCAYCAIPGIRGDMISRPMEDILADAQHLIDLGVKELVLVAQDTTSYGLDIYQERKFADLLRKIAELQVPRIRFLYAYADGMTDEVLEVMASHPNIVHYIDLPIQHASDAVLKSMYRADRASRLRETFARIRRYLPDVSLRTTVMVGFPGETDEDYQELLAFIDELQFDHLGCFVFSPEEGTSAATMKDTVDPEIAQNRYDQVMRLQQGIHESKIKAILGDTQDVLIEGVAEDGIFYTGRSFAQAPEIDTLCYVLFEQGEAKLGEIYPVRFIETQAYDLIGVCESELTE